MLTNFTALSPDPRLASSGSVLPLPKGYADQPYVVVLADGSWLCLVTSADGHEGDSSQGVFCLRSTDHGQEWTSPVRLEPAGSPENSYAVGLVTPAGRIYAFYNYNTANLREVKTEDGDALTRVDSLGDYVFRYSDDTGQTWSQDRYTVPVREFACDRSNVYGGKVRFFWNVGRPCTRANGEVIIPLHKVGAMGAGFFAQSEGAFIASSNILTELDPKKITFETLPEGEHGLGTPKGGGRIAEEHSLVELSDGSLYCVYRSVDGWPVCTYSRDGGHLWEAPDYKTFTPGGKRMKNPRAANFAWKLTGGRYLYWFHNHGGDFIRKLGGHSSLPNGLSPVNGRSPYDDRNPVWLCAGREIDGPHGKRFEWSQPEIFLYDDDPMIRMSYPDLIEQDGQVWITETDKINARVHQVDPSLLEDMFGQFNSTHPTKPEPLLHAENPGETDWQLAMPELPLLIERDYDALDFRTKDLRGGCSVELVIDGIPVAGTVVFDSRSGEGAGILVRAISQARLEIVLSDARGTYAWTSDVGSLTESAPNHVGIIVDGGPKLILFVINGVLCDGGDARQFGWGRYNRELREINGASEADVDASVREIALYGRALRVSEVIHNGRLRLAASSKARDLALS
jgi:hypothetical protein